MDSRKPRKQLQGVVVSNKMKDTVVIQVATKKRHPRYEKLIETQKKYYAHTTKDLEIGQNVTIMSCRPISKLKRWRVVN